MLRAIASGRQNGVMAAFGLGKLGTALRSVTTAPGATPSSTIAPATAILFFVGLSALLVIVGTTTWLSKRSESQFTEIARIRDFRSAILELRAAVQAAETSQRGYLLTENEIYLSPFGLEKNKANRNLGLLVKYIPAATQQDKSLSRLRSVIQQKFAEMEETITLKRAHRDTDVALLLKTNKGKRLTDESNIYYAGLAAYADQLLFRVSEEQGRNFTLLQVVSFVGGIIIVFVTATAAMFSSRYTRAISRSRDEVNRLNSSLEIRVRERTAHLAQLNEEVRRFAYIVTHDLRAPLVNIMGFTREIEESVGAIRPVLESTPQTEGELERAIASLNRDIPEAISFIQSSTQKMDALINAILKLSREGQRKLNVEPIDLLSGSQKAIAALQHRINECGGQVRFDLKVKTIVTDRISFEQIIGNLLDNAVKYRSKERVLEIRIASRPVGYDRVAIEISDNGRGIAAEDRERVFELFRRSGALDQAGEGIGLAHVRALVRNLGGEITLASQFGQGTTFTIEMPVTHRQAEVFTQ